MGMELTDKVKIGSCYYDLVGVVQHYGTAYGGHYVYFQQQSEKNWIRISDSDVS